MDIASLLAKLKEESGSDVHLSAGAPVMMRVHGRLLPLDEKTLTKENLHTLLYDILTDEQKAKFEANREMDFSIELEGIARFRVNTFYQRRGEGVVFRLIPSIIKTVTELGLPETLLRFIHLHRGLVLVTGPTGSGKSTTLAALIDAVNSEREDHIITIEDPIEFVHHNKKCMVNQREVGAHTQSFANALRSALREDPDVILVGEMRDLETTSMAISAAETGHLVFTTLHTNSAPQTIDRIVDIFPPHQQGQIRAQLGEALAGVVCQTLIPTIDGFGRICALEVMVGTPAVRALIREGKTHQLPSIIQTSAKVGMQSLDQHLKTLSMQGKIKGIDAYERAINKEAFTQYAPLK
ncbi:MAG: type IV pilus twitching motility protein PilT [bacterium]|nr:type IV pilus twitching motility protein PilT [bacterium]